MNEAIAFGIPIILLPLSGRGLSLDSARAIVANIKAELLDQDPGALAEVERHGGINWGKFQASLLGIIDNEARRAHPLRWDPSEPLRAALSQGRPQGT